MKMFFRIALALFILSSTPVLFGQGNKCSQDDNLLLSKWQMKSTVLEKTSGENISTGQFTQNQWYSVEVPTTVLNGLVKNGVYPDPRLDMNNYLIPDISDEFNAKYNLAQYSYLPNHENPWKNPYWFRTEFTVPQEQHGRQAWLNFNGINYRAEVWLNGKRIADSSEMAGMFQRFKYNITNALKENGTNYLAVKIFPLDHPGIPGTQLVPNSNNRGPAEDIFKDLTLKISGGWDCAMPVRDRNMGIYQKVYVSFTDNVDIINPYIITDLKLPDTSTAYLNISATLTNVNGQKVHGVLKGKIDLLKEVDMVSYTKTFPGDMQSITFEKEVDVPANDAVTVSFSINDFPQLTVKDPHLWWPVGYGEQYLHNLQLSFVYDNKVSACKNTTFGIRKVTSTLKEIKGNYGMVFSINGKRVFCKGGWTQPDMLLDLNKKRLYDEARLLTNANMNMVGTEDMPSPTEDFMDACDKYGIMLWETFYQCWTTVPGTKSAYYPLDHYLAIQNARDIIVRYRNNPSLVVWCAENENVPGPDLYFALRDDLKTMDVTRPFIPTSSTLWDWEKLTPYIKDEMPVGVTDIGAPGYSWHPSAYFFDKIDEVKLQMFRDELGIPSVPTLSSLKKFIFNPGSKKDNPIFPLDSVWAEHGVWDVNNYAYKAYDDAIRNNYGFNTKSIEDYVRIAQIVNADGYRAMFEAANSRMWDITSGVMLWKLNCSAPDVLWSIYDWYLNPHAGYYFTKKACEPLHIQMNANDYMVSIINTNHWPINNLKVRARVYDMSLKLKWEKEEALNVGEDKYQEVFRVPQPTELAPIYLVKLELLDKAGKVVSNNFYWESTKTPVDFSGLSYLENGKVRVSYTKDESKEEVFVHVKVKNTSDKLSFLNRIAIVRTDTKEEILPTIWNDNYVTLLPGEETNLEARISKADLQGAKFTVILDKE